MNTRILTLGLLAVAVLVRPEPADACSTLAEIRVRAVGHAQAAGPFVFLLLCGPNLTRCAEGPPDVRVRQGGAELAGATKLKAEVPGRGQLVEWVPATPLQPGVDYVAGTAAALARGDWATWTDTFQLAPVGSSAPFEGMAATAQWLEFDRGTLYSCQGIGTSCSPFLSWSSEGWLEPSLSLSHARNDGWLFRSSEAGKLVCDWDPDPTCHTTTSQAWTEAEGWTFRACFKLEAWNVLDGTRLERELCATPPAKSEAERRVARATPDLSRCIAPPMNGNTVAPELRDVWCKQRASVCAGSRPSECAAFDALCRSGAAGATTDAGAVTPGVSDAAVATSAAGQVTAPVNDAAAARAASSDAAEAAAEASAAPELDESDADSAGCSVSRGPVHNLSSLVLLALLLGALRRASRSARSHVRAQRGFL